ncbi:uncharacterized protein LOC114575330 [Exaiptasia diaphana]|uniref:Uncharacterized protein n=1 Tax=Exaiptasia diaphana TaxID=2652724 RepID=A0A913YMS7_EXADI|nr:uncharacterized protein LOC114575330 [Exaiptasia diaphana]
MIELQEAEAINLESNIDRYCTSTLLLSLCRLGMERVVDAWNNHSIPSKGIPNELASCNWDPIVDENRFPPSEIASAMYTQELGTSLHQFCSFASSPFQTEEKEKEVEIQFSRLIPDMGCLLNSAMNNQYSPMQNALLTLINITKHNL